MRDLILNHDNQLVGEIEKRVISMTLKRSIQLYLVIIYQLHGRDPRYEVFVYLEALNENDLISRESDMLYEGLFNSSALIPNGGGLDFMFAAATNVCVKEKRQ